MEQKKWTNRDWMWLVSILIAIIILVLTYRLSDNQEVTNLFSFISSSVSIALALVAIVITLKQDSDNQRLTRQMHETLARIDEKLNSVGEKVSSIDIGNIQNAILNIFEEKLENTVTKISNLFEDKKDGNVKEEAIEIVKNEFMNAISKLNSEIEKQIIDKNHKENINRYIRNENARVYSGTETLEKIIYQILLTDKEKVFTINDIRNLILLDTGNFTTLARIRLALNRLILEGLVTEVEKDKGDKKQVGYQVRILGENQQEASE
ncbi:MULTISPECIES: hypothetical protein [Geobacillus]|uniref:hypothetical protein n=1 Tax=Geobacillus TaxID=129337 RepID=UPI0006E65021|nr:MULTISPECIES: hypothetical protein [Geobacillus]KQB91892.1 putative membrane protein [Geobacillus sp. PA-3]MED4916723.1 hypothetical protein [Geobacillus thermodenitrificans]